MKGKQGVHVKYIQFITSFICRINGKMYLKKAFEEGPVIFKK